MGTRRIKLQTYYVRGGKMKKKITLSGPNRITGQTKEGRQECCAHINIA
jgi:hypothetical protein